MKHSPTISKSSEEPNAVPNSFSKNFYKAIQTILDGGKITRDEWPTGYYMSIVDKHVCLFDPEDKQHHPLILRTVDIKATDWKEV